MKNMITALLISAGLLAGTAFADSNGDNNGKPFQELQAAVDAAVAAEAAARAAADAAEASAREAADSALQAEIDAQEGADECPYSEEITEFLWTQARVHPYYNEIDLCYLYNGNYSASLQIGTYAGQPTPTIFMYPSTTISAYPGDAITNDESRACRRLIGALCYPTQ